MEAAFRACGLAVGEVDLRSLIGPPIRTILARMAAKQPSEEELDQLERSFRWSYDCEGWRMTPHYEGAAEALRRLQAEGRAAVCGVEQAAAYLDEDPGGRGDGGPV